MRELVGRVGEDLLRDAGIGAELRLREPQCERERDEPLLRAVVQVALEPPALGVGGLDEPRARPLQLAELHLELPLQPLALEHQPGARERAFQQLTLVEERSVVLEQRQRPAELVLEPDRDPVLRDRVTGELLAVGTR